MPQEIGVVVENNFVNGLITEATGLNFPDNAVTETYDCEFDLDGSVYRRPGFDLEGNYITKDIDRTGVVVSSYLWRNVAGNGSATIAVVQVGDVIYFYETNGTGIFSAGIQTTTVTLTPVSGAPIITTTEAQFSDGNGYLFITHPYCDPLRVSYDIDAHTATAETLNLKIRDFEGALADPYDVDERPTSDLASLNINHKYNLYNQGWNTTNLTAWDTAQTTMPSNADVMWRFTDSSDNFDASNDSIARVNSGNTPAPRGHYILNLANQDRATASGISGVASTTTGFQRPSVSAFFAGRVFYTGINYVGFNSDIYFTQIVERLDQYEKCHQVNDPTAEDLFDLLPSDGGVISIPEAGTIYKLFTMPGGLCVFAANGVWFITGSEGLGFTAVDYSVQKIADISTISASSFVNILGTPCWWNSEGIYILTGQGNIPQAKNLTLTTIQQFFNAIPVSSKRLARGFFQPLTGVIRWIYKSESTNSITKAYEFDRILSYNTKTQAFYPSTISPSDIKVNSIISTELLTSPVEVLNVIDSSGDLVKDSLGNQVIAFSPSGSDSLSFDKYLVSYKDGDTYKFTFADKRNEEYVDWKTYDGIGVNYLSYFITGFKLRGQGIRRVQANWVRVFSRLEDPVSFYFQGIWDFAKTGSGTGRWSANQLVEHDNLNYGTASKRLKVRGHGEALQFRVSSLQGESFDIVGWASTQSVDQQP
jgi:hypothetical protein